MLMGSRWAPQLKIKRPMKKIPGQPRKGGREKIGRRGGKGRKTFGSEKKAAGRARKKQVESRCAQGEGRKRGAIEDSIDRKTKAGASGEQWPPVKRR